MRSGETTISLGGRQLLSSLVDHEARVPAILSAIHLCLVLLAFALSGLTFDAGLLLGLLAAPSLLFGSGLLLKHIRHARAGSLCQAASLLICCSVASLLSSYPMGASAAPYVDSVLQAADQRLRFDWLAGLRFTIGFPSGLLLALDLAYQTLWLQAFVMLLILFASGRVRQGWIFVGSWAMCLAICVISFAFTPALGPFASYGVSEASDLYIQNASDVHVTQLRQLKAGTFAHLASADATGLIAIPSFHAASLTLYLWAAFQVRFVWTIAVPICLLGLYATIFIGAHYLIDLIVGIVVMLVCIAFVERFIGPAANMTLGPEQAERHRSFVHGHHGRE